MAIYVVQKGQAGAVKIGYSDHLRNRLRTLRKRHGDELCIRRLFVGTRRDETIILNRFRCFRLDEVQGEQEWFLPAEEILHGSFDLQELIVPEVGARKAAKDHPLMMWRAKHQLPMQRAAELFGLHVGSLNNIEKGSHKPSFEIMHKFYVVTDGEINPTSLVMWWIDNETSRLLSANGFGIGRSEARRFISEQTRKRMSVAALRRHATKREPAAAMIFAAEIISVNAEDKA